MTKKATETASKNVKKNNTKNNSDIYLFISSCVFIVLLIFFVYSLLMSFSITKNETVTYTEKSDIDYKIYLKENDFYDMPYLNKGMAYVASLIDSINIKYNYVFDVSTESNIDLHYQIIAKLVIASQNNANIFYEKEYELVNNTKDHIYNGKNYSLTKEVDIDYVYYNDLANKFRSNYAVNTTSYLEVYLLVQENNAEDNHYKLANQSRTTLKIPLSEQEITVALENQNVNDKKEIIFDGGLIVKNKNYVYVSAILAVLLFISFILFVKRLINTLDSKVNKYDRFIERILRGYDRIIVTVKTEPDLDNYNVVKVASIDELIDVRDNVKEPINYYVIKEHQNCAFYVVHNKALYLYAIKNSEIDEEDSNAKR